MSNWRADYSLAEYLEKNGIPGIQGIDTRALTKKLRVRGALNGFISTEDISATPRRWHGRRHWPGLVGVDYVKEVTHKKSFLWDEKDEQSASFNLIAGIGDDAIARNVREPLPPADIPIVAYDFGMKYNILRRLRQHGFKVQVVPATTPAAEALQAQAGRDFSFQRPGRSRRRWVTRCRRCSDLVKSGDSDFRHLPRAPDSGPGVWRKDLQAEVRPSRRQPAGEGSGVGQSGNHLAKPRVCGGSEVAAGRDVPWTGSI